MADSPRINSTEDSGNYIYVIIGIIILILVIGISIGIWYWYSNRIKTVPVDLISNPSTTLDSESNPILKDKHYIVSPNEKYMFGVDRGNLVLRSRDKKYYVITNISYQDKPLKQDILDVIEACNQGKMTEDPIYLTMDPECKLFDAKIENSIIVNAHCLITAMQEKLAQSLKNISSTSIAGLDLPGSSNEAESLQKIKQRLRNMCGNMSSTQKLDPTSDINISLCKIVYVQNATKKTKCEIEALQKALVQTASKINTESRGQILTLYPDGNLVLKTPVGKVVYSTGAIGPGHYTLSITDDGKLILSDGKGLAKTINL